MAKCTVKYCDNKANVPGSARGLCRAHYRRWQRYGDVYEPVRRTYSQKGLQCDFENCTTEPYALMLCEKHYAAVRRAKNYESQRVRNERQRERDRQKKIELAGRPPPETCELCGEVANVVWDHDHQTGLFRGWLCDRCNRVLGSVKDDVVLLSKMIDYLIGVLPHGEITETHSSTEKQTQEHDVRSTGRTQISD